ncbi:hypothetical protein [Dyella mobilis]|uniref:Uncharacterized protein n=1 Tax=Dyella mobilis TaxID=1849582 RepID=A0ABS2KK47_9GAMM|nr:hypothetical protein [Dyella mobilis]MBM7131516.1 hypothetical protein [Dyella mobilis]GLQ96513.1 hypothetical protein GCM10007863_09310 [Dyella mobilis]
MRAAIKAWSFLFLILLGVSAPRVHAAEKSQCSDLVKFEPITTLPLNYLGWLADPISSSNANGGVVFWPFDEESYPTRGEWASLGIVLGNSGDIGAQSIGGIIWVKKSMRPHIDYKAADKSSRVTFTVRDEQEECSQEITFELDSNRNVNFGGKVIGKAKSIAE